MKAIVISAELFIVNTLGVAAAIGKQFVSISTTETHSESRYDGSFNDNVPDYKFVSGNDWLKIANKFGVIELESREDLLSLYNLVQNAYEDQFESVEDFVQSHGYFPINVN